MYVIYLWKHETCMEMRGYRHIAYRARNVAQLDTLLSNVWISGFSSIP